MEYQLYIFLLIQMMSVGTSTLAIDGRQISFTSRPGKESLWNISVKVASVDKNSPLIKECFPSQKQMFFHSGGSSLSQKENGVYFEREVKALNRYVLFRSVIKDFLEELLDWEAIFKQKI